MNGPVTPASTTPLLGAGPVLTTPIGGDGTSFISSFLPRFLGVTHPPDPSNSTGTHNHISTSKP